MAATYNTRVYVIIYLSVVLKDLDVRKVAVVCSNPKPNNSIRFRLYWGHHDRMKITRFENTRVQISTKTPA